MIQDLYLSIGIICLLSIIYQIKNFNQIHFIYEWYYKFDKLTKNKPKKNDFRKKSDYDIYNKVNILIVFDSFWIVGLIFTYYFYLPIIYFLIFSFLKLTILKKNRWTLLGKFITFISIISRLIIVFTVLYCQFIKEIILTFL
jgi:hypothetical protein